MAKKKKKTSGNVSSLRKQKPSKFQRELAQAFQAFQSQKFRFAHDACVNVLKTEPKNADAKMLLGLIAYEHKDWPVVIEFLKDAVKVNSKIFSVHFSLARAYHELSYRDKAKFHYKAAVSLKEGDTQALIYLGVCYGDDQNFEAAMETYQKVLAIEPDSAAALNNIALTQAALGEISCAIRRYEYCSKLYPDRADNISNLLTTQNYLPPNDKFQWFESSKSHVEKLFESLLNQPIAHHSRENKQKIKVGLVSADLYRHSVEYFLRSFLLHYDRNKLEVTAFYTATKEDEFTEFVKDQVFALKNINELANNKAADLIVADEIDVLVDLTGHFRNNRLDIFARRAAPVQVAWLGYPNTTALSSMDYRLVDDITDPQGLTDGFYTEELYRLPRGFLCFVDDESAAVSDEIPNKKSEFFTFGCFNNSEKISSAVIRAWSEVLARVPNARLLLKSRHFANASVKKHYLKLFSEAGVSSERIELRGFVKGGTHLQLYNEVDLALDTFPYNGTTTTCQSLWMGVPTVTFTGDLHASRVSASILHRVGLDDFVADDVEGYIETAIKMAGQVDYLSELKVTLRDRMLKSDLCDGEGFARQMEEAFEWMLEQKRAKQA
jgi:predicted O-linked N-acetylglucosamine transferase (SPINDLY family)